MRKTSVAHAKAHFSELVDLAEHKGQRILVLRHGKPAAAIVPASALAERSAILTAEEAATLLDRIAGPPVGASVQSIDELLGRDRLDARR